MNFRHRGCTRWTKEGRAAYEAKVFEAGDVKVILGEHFNVKEPEEQDDYYAGVDGASVMPVDSRVHVRGRRRWHSEQTAQ